MTNRFFPSHVTVFPNCVADSKPGFDKDQYQALSIELDLQLLELEQRQSCKTIIFQDRQENVAATVGAGSETEPCTYDDFGLVQGLEIDVSWM